MKSRLKLPNGKTLDQIKKTSHFICHADGTMWELSDMTIENGKLRRWLFRFDSDTGKTDSKEKYPVPEEWEGEPEDICIKEAEWAAMQSDSRRMAEIRTILKNGHNVYLINDKSERVKSLYFTTNKDELITRPI